MRKTILAVLLACALTEEGTTLPAVQLYDGAALLVRRTEGSNGKVVCRTFQAFTHTNMWVWKIVGKEVMATEFKRPLLQRYTTVGSSVVSSEYPIPDQWFPGMAIPAVTATNWSTNALLGSGYIATGQGAYTYASTESDNPAWYSRISESRHIAMWPNWGDWIHNPCPDQENTGKIYFVYRKGRATENYLFPATVTGLFSPGRTNIVDHPFPVGDYWFLMGDRICSGCDNPCWDRNWRDTPDNVAILNTLSVPLPRLTVQQRSKSVTPVSFSAVLHLESLTSGVTRAMLEIPSASGFSVESKPDPAGEWQATEQFASPSGAILATTEGTNNSRLFRMVSNVSSATGSSAVDTNDPCRAAVSSMTVPAPLNTEDLTTFRSFRLVQLQR